MKLTKTTTRQLPPGLDELPSGRIRARYRDAEGKQNSKTFVGVREAQRWRTAQMASVDDGTHVAKSDARFEEYAKERVETWRKHRATTRLQVESHMRNHVYPYLGSRRLDSIDRSHVEQWVRERSEVLAPATVHVVFSWLSRVFADAVRARLIVASPCDYIDLPVIEPTEVQPLPLDAVDAVTDRMPEQWQAIVQIAAWAGLRQGEILGLRKHRLDLLGSRDDRGRRRAPSINVAEQLQTLPGGPRLVPPKTKASQRRVPIPEHLVQALAEDLTTVSVEPEGLLFTNIRTGAPILRQGFGDVWRRSIRQAGLPKGTRFHTLRHTYASMLIEAGESVTVVSRRLGHASATETLQTYSHLWPDSDDRTVDVLDQAYRRHVSRDVSRQAQ
jgi:integrase